MRPFETVTRREVAINQDLKALICSDRAHPEYMAHVVKAAEPVVLKWVRATTADNFPIDNLKNLEIPLSSIDEQRRIAGILDQANALRCLRARALDKLDTLGQAIFHEMFGDPVSNNRGWKVQLLGEISSLISSGSTPVGGKKNYVENGISFLRSQNVWRGRLELDDLVYIDESTHRRMRKTALMNGDLLITKTGRINTENSSLGRAAIFEGADGSGNINGHVYLIRLLDKQLSEFVQFILATKEYRDYIRRVCVGGIDKRQINKEHIEEFPIIDPPLDRKLAFIGALKHLKRVRQQCFRQSNDAELLFASLQHRAFRGEL